MEQLQQLDEGRNLVMGGFDESRLRKDCLYEERQMQQTYYVCSIRKD